MQNEELTAVFDRQAASYDQQWGRLAPLNEALYLLTRVVLGELPPDAHILCVGAGTGTEILDLAAHFPGWRFTAVEPSAAMLEVCRQRAEEQGIAERCTFHLGYLESLPAQAAFDAATVFLVSHFILERELRVQFFQSIAERLSPNGVLVSSDLAGAMAAAAGQELLEVWCRVMSGGSPSPEALARMREAYSRDVAVLPPQEVGAIIAQGGFAAPVLFFQAGMIHAWYAQRAPSRPEAESAP